MRARAWTRAALAYARVAGQDGATPMYVAAQNGHGSVVAVLQSAGASLEAAANVRAVASCCIVMTPHH